MAARIECLDKCQGTVNMFRGQFPAGKAVAVDKAENANACGAVLGEWFGDLPEAALPGEYAEAELVGQSVPSVVGMMKILFQDDGRTIGRNDLEHPVVFPP